METTPTLYIITDPHYEFWGIAVAFFSMEALKQTTESPVSQSLPMAIICQASLKSSFLLKDHARLMGAKVSCCNFLPAVVFAARGNEGGKLETNVSITERML